MATIQGIYLAFFGRPADPAGLAYWKEATANGTDLSVMLSSLSGTTEYQDRFGESTQEQIITSVYQTLFGRTPDQDGLNFFVAQLASGTQSIASIAANILDGASGNDLATVANKEVFADQFTQSLDTPAKIAAYTGATAVATAKSLLGGVTSDPASIPSSQAIEEAINSQAAANTPPSTGGGGGGPSFPPGYFDKPDRPDIYLFEDSNSAFISGPGVAGGTARLFKSSDNSLLAELPINNGGWGYQLDDGEAYSVYVVIRSVASVDSNPSNIIVVGSTGSDVLNAPDQPNPDFALAQAFGRDGNDTIQASNSGNYIAGGDGDDTLIGGTGPSNQFSGGPGADFIDGSAGSDPQTFDEVSYNDENGPYGVIINLQDDWAKDAFVAYTTDVGGVVLWDKGDYNLAELDTLIGIDGLSATNQDDIIIGLDDGFTLIRPYLGNDLIFGGNGLTEVHYALGPIEHIEVNLATGLVLKYAQNGWNTPAEGYFTDTISGIERVRGSAGNDIITGDGNDNLFRSLRGADTIDGGGGRDVLDYGVDIRYGGGSGINAVLFQNQVTDGFGELDSVTNVEDVRGTNFNDTIVGNAANNRLEGMRGNDLLDGLSGSDELVGGNGDDAFVFRTIASSTFNGLDGHSSVLDFRADGDNDKIQLNSNFFSANGTLSEASGDLTAASFDLNVQAILDGQAPGGAGANYVALVTANGGDLNGRTFLIVDDGNGSFAASEDIVIELTGTSIVSGLSNDWFTVV